MNTDKDVVDDPAGVVMAVVLGKLYGNALGYEFRWAGCSR
jgi:hypothetical protein